MATLKYHGDELDIISYIASSTLPNPSIFHPPILKDLDPCQSFRDKNPLAVQAVILAEVGTFAYTSTDCADESMMDRGLCFECCLSDYPSSAFPAFASDRK